jgi:hypothetical protein
MSMSAMMMQAKNHARCLGRDEVLSKSVCALLASFTLGDALAKK